MKCSNIQHTDVPIRGKSGRVRCSTCGDVFPCRGDKCEHLDCCDATGRAWPERYRTEETR